MRWISTRSVQVWICVVRKGVRMARHGRARCWVEIMDSAGEAEGEMTEDEEWPPTRPASGILRCCCC